MTICYVVVVIILLHFFQMKNITPSEQEELEEITEVLQKSSVVGLRVKSVFD